MSRIGGAMFGVAIIVMVSARESSYALAGAVSAVGVVVLAASSPVIGGLVDRWGQRRVRAVRGAGRHGHDPVQPAGRARLDRVRQLCRLLVPTRDGADVAGALGAHLFRGRGQAAYGHVVRAGSRGVRVRPRTRTGRRRGHDPLPRGRTRARVCRVHRRLPPLPRAARHRTADRAARGPAGWLRDPPPRRGRVGACGCHGRDHLRGSFRGPCRGGCWWARWRCACWRRPR